MLCVRFVDSRVQPFADQALIKPKDKYNNKYILIYNEVSTKKNQNY